MDALLGLKGGAESRRAGNRRHQRLHLLVMIVFLFHEMLDQRLHVIRGGLSGGTSLVLQASRQGVQLAL